MELCFSNNDSGGAASSAVNLTDSVAFPLVLVCRKNASLSYTMHASIEYLFCWASVANVCRNRSKRDWKRALIVNVHVYVKVWCMLINGERTVVA